MVKKITNLRNSGVKIGQLDVDIITQVRNNPGSETMVANLGQGISEHVHGKSLYFVSNANLTLEGKKHKIKHPAFFVLIPEGLSHGWQHAGGQGLAVITSFEPGHDKYNTYPLK